MEIQTKAKLLTAESKPYNVSGNEGVSHKLRFNIEGEIYVCRSSAEQVRSFESLTGQDGDVVIRVNSRKENLSLECVSFIPSKKA